jgi:3-methyl-2-oxobutanoate hydroxymethyltransferase
MKRDGEKISMLTAYDYPFARILDQAGIDILLVGDSLGTVVQGHSTTLPVTMDEMVYHCRMVARACGRAHVVGDMPFGAYQTSVDDAVSNACRLIKEGGVQSVKLEGGERVADRIHAISRMDIPVMGHVGLTPQSVHRMGGYRVQGRGSKGHDQLLRDAAAVEEAGAFAVVLEGIPRDLAHEVGAAVRIPTIGIGAGEGCDGQVLVLHDLIGLALEPAPKFARQYVNVAEIVSRAAQMYREDVREQKFPAEHESY